MSSKSHLNHSVAIDVSNVVFIVRHVEMRTSITNNVYTHDVLINLIAYTNKIICNIRDTNV